MEKDHVIIGIAPGNTFTGIAVWSISEGKLKHATNGTLHKAFFMVDGFLKMYNVVHIRLIDHRLTRRKFKFFRSHDSIGVHHNCSIWSNYIKELDLIAKITSYELVDPATVKKMDMNTFILDTLYVNPTNQDGRDAGSLVYGYDQSNMVQS